MAERLQLDLKIWLEDDIWRYYLALPAELSKTGQQVDFQGFSDDFDALLQEAIAVTEEHAEVLKRDQ